ncbi:MAG: hypothetical protein VB934_00290 [Polyangiaceae bacterium]
MGDRVQAQASLAHADEARPALRREADEADPQLSEGDGLPRELASGEKHAVAGQDLSLAVDEAGSAGSPYRHDSRRAGVVMISDVAQPAYIVLRG